MRTLRFVGFVPSHAALVLLLVAMPGASRAEGLYKYSSDFFDNVSGSYTTSDRLTGQFTTDLPLAANRPFQDISGLVTGFSFTDGHLTLTEADIGSFFVYEFMVSTDSAGEISDWRINLFVSGSHLIQAKSEAGSHNDAGQVDATNFGAIADSRGSWIIPSPTAYGYTSDFFDNVSGSYTTSDRLTGQFTTDLPLAANRPFQDISGLVTGFSFTDGHLTLTEADIGSFFVYEFMVSTDSAGEISDWRINLFVSGSHLIQAKSEAGSHNDAGQVDAINFGAIADSRGSWIIRGPAAVPALSPPLTVALAVLVLGLALVVIQRGSRSL